MKGVPLRIELGPRDIEAGKFVAVRRDETEKAEYARADAVKTVQTLLDLIKKSLFARAQSRMQSRTVTAASLDELLQGVEGGNFVRAGWCGERACEDKVKEFAQATARVIDENHTEKVCVCCGKPATHTVFFARAY